MTYKIGQQVAHDCGRTLTGQMITGANGEALPTWYVLKVQPMREFEVREWLSGEAGVLEAWLPTEKAWRNQARGHRRKVPYKKRIAPGYVFIYLSHVMAWDLLLSRSNGKVLGVVGREGSPLAVPESQMRAMKKLPKTVQKIHAQRQEAAAIKPGTKARILDDGPMCDWIVDVSEVNGGIAKIFVPLLGVREAEIATADLERVGGCRESD